MTPMEQARAAGRLLADRRMRADIIVEARDGLGEPAWDMLLCLMADSARRPAMPADELVAGAGVKESIARTFIGWMETRCLARHDEAGDCVALTDRGRERMAAYLESVRVAT